MINEEFEHNYNITVKLKDGKLNYTLWSGDKMIRQEIYVLDAMPRGLMPSIVQVLIGIEQGKNVGFVKDDNEICFKLKK